MNALEHNH
jgi:myo-inositol-1-phosphate synthase